MSTMPVTSVTGHRGISLRGNIHPTFVDTTHVCKMTIDPVKVA